MEISRLTFTKETKEKMEKGLNKRQRGKLRFERLQEAEKDGRLQKAKTRMDIARIAGFSDRQYKTGYSWVMNMLTRKHLIEHMVALGKNGRAEYEYSLGSTPDYGMAKTTAGRLKANEQKKAEATESGKVFVWTDEAPTVSPTPPMVTIKYGELSIELGQIDPNITIRLITELLNKVMKGE